ncbi:serine beta-lactamase-like protein LACTB, mitochondrial isoform X1 [Convolutriloba macropyga]|uniref:serine beta-lactamase-like protein LACTB, mitochondrial isoform X1 n=1 Tax=Convolutriloba macropyga TaxID=536237 RepID=UPI003F51B880
MIGKQTYSRQLFQRATRFISAYKQFYQRSSSISHRIKGFPIITPGIAGAALALMGLYQLSPWRKKSVHAETERNSIERMENLPKMSSKCDKKRLFKVYKQNIRRTIELYRVTNAIPGMICRVQIGTQPVFEKGFGYCNVEQLLSCDPTQSVFRVASISKLITGVLTLKLASEGKIDLDDSIYKHLKDFPKKRIDGREVDITIRQLLNHTSGIRDYLPVGSTLTGEERTAEIAKNSQRNDEFVSLSESIKFFKDDDLLHKPGSKFHYSTYAVVLLSAVLEKVIDKPFHEYIHDFVRQLGMNHTMPEPTPKSREIVLNRLPCYLFNTKTVSLTLAPEITIMHKTAGGGMLSTLSDLCRLGTLLADQFAGTKKMSGVKEEVFDQILRPPKGKEVPVPGRPNVKYSLGFGVYEEDPSFPAGTVMVGHSGATTGMCSYLLICAPKGDWSTPIIVTIAANMDNKVTYLLVKHIVRETINLMEDQK